MSWLRSPPHAKRHTLYYSRNESGQTVIVACGRRDDPPHRGLIGGLEAASQRVRQKLFRKRAHELIPALLDQQLFQTGGSIKFDAVWQLSFGVDRNTGVLGAP